MEFKLLQLLPNISICKLFQFVIVYLLLVVNSSYGMEKSTIGIKVGNLYHSDNIFKKVYIDFTHPITIFYKQQLKKSTTIDIGAGFIKANGEAITESSHWTTTLKTDLILVPIHASFIRHFYRNLEISPYLGGGLNLWYYQEKTIIKEKLGIVGGYHVKCGTRISTDLHNVKNLFYSIEAEYSVIDRFKKNKLNLGGLYFNIGISYNY